METVERDFADKGVNFYYVYKALAHPENNGYIAPFNLKERLMHVAEAKKKLGTRIPWLCDSMDNDLKHALGDRPNSEFVIDPEGNIVVSRSWSSPKDLREDLERLVGKPERVTTIADLSMPRLQPPEKAATGIVKRISVPDGMSPMKVKPIVDASKKDTPHYAKLRAEMSRDQLYLGFYLDPLYKVHWNNKAPLLRFSINPPPGMTVTPDQGTGPKVEVAADADPREFMVSVSGDSAEPLEVKVTYFACDDAETFCIPVTQTYEVTLQRDRDGGNRRSSSGRGRPQTAGGRGRAPGSRMLMMLQRHPVMSALDSDSDGVLSPEELASATESLMKVDRDRDGKLSPNEMRLQMSR